MSPSSPGRIITFYSYKGGTGRSMALINVAWILASNGKRVLVLDWDLEAPGLHRYLAPFLADKELTASDGIIDFVHKFMTAAASRPATVESPSPAPDRDWYRPYANILRYSTSIQWRFDGEGTLDFIPAGRQGPSYSTRVNSFSWQFFYDRLGGGTLLEIAKEKMRAEYDFILIDSRTGVSDTSGICTVQMPDTLVICFTLNNQSIEGAAAVARSVFDQRTAAAGLKIAIFPVPMRIENAEKAKLRVRLEAARQRLRPFPNTLDPDQWDEYWREVQILYVPYYAYEEILACFGDNPTERISVLSACEQLTSHLTGGDVNRLRAPSPEERQKVLREYESGTHDPQTELARFTDGVLARLDPKEQAAARGLFTRLVRVKRGDELGNDALIQVPVKEIEESARAVINPLVRAGMVVRETDASRGEVLRVADPNLLESWPRLQGWIESDRSFLTWRDRLREKARLWEEEDRDSSLLLRGPRLDTAAEWWKKHSDRLNEQETLFLLSSLRKAGRLDTSTEHPLSRWRKIAAFVLAVSVAILATLVVISSLRDRQTLTERLVEASVSYIRPRGFVILDPVRTVSVRLRGSRKIVRELNPFMVNVQVSLSQTQPGRSSIPLGPEDVLIPEGLEVVAIEPGTLEVELDREITDRLPVVPQIVGKPAAGAVAGEPEVFPNQALVTGPESLLERTQSVSTRPINLNGHALTFEESVAVVAPDPLIQVVQPSKVMVRVTIRKK